MSKILAAKQIVLDAAVQAYKAGLFAGTSGNLSVCLREEQMVVITPSSVRYEGMTVDDIMVTDMEGTTVEGPHSPSSETLMHCYVYQGNESVNAVVHTHSPYATGFAVNNRPIPLILVEMLPFLGGDVPVAEIAFAGTREMGVSAIAAMGQERYACLLANHGVLAVGSDMAQAYLRAEYVEDAAKICNFATITGEIRLIPKDMETAMRDRRKSK